MQIRNTRQRWGGVTQTLHWLVVLLVLSQLTVGFTLGDLPQNDPLAPKLFPVHTTLGISIFLIMVLRLLWRLGNRVPLLPDTLPPWQKWLAHANHWLFYILLIGLPIGGYLVVSGHGHPVPFFIWQLPPVIGKSERLANLIMILHASGAVVLTVLIVLHVSAALRHALLLRDGVLRRMTPFRSKPD
jgi:cytochrome b561